jgi:hypothetical protein
VSVEKNCGQMKWYENRAVWGRGPLNSNEAARNLSQTGPIAGGYFALQCSTSSVFLPPLDRRSMVVPSSMYVRWALIV